MAVLNVVNLASNETIPVNQFIIVVTDDAEEAVECFVNRFNRTPDTVYGTGHTYRIEVTEQEFENAKSRARIITH